VARAAVAARPAGPRAAGGEPGSVSAWPPVAAAATVTPGFNSGLASGKFRVGLSVGLQVVGGT
jgi:hypothetical protein